MSRHKVISLLLLLAVSFTALGQTEMEGKEKPKPKRKDQSHFTLKVYYYTPNLKLKDNFMTDYSIGKVSGVANHSALGFSLYIPLGQTFFLQPEALFSLTTDWMAASNENSILGEFSYAFKHRDGIAMDVPLLFGVKWAPSKMLRAKAYVGPMFHLGWLQKEFQSNFNPYTITVGGGLDLLNFLAVDMGYMVRMKGMSYTHHSQWFVAVGIVM
jgi:hypothetical protein